MSGLRIIGMTAGTLCVLLLTSGDATVSQSQLDADSARVGLEEDPPSSANEPGETSDKAVSGAPSERHAMPRSDETGPNNSTECLRRETVRADVDGDDLPDLVYHDYLKRGAVLGVCTARGEVDRMMGAGQTEILEIIDVEEDGRDEIFFGGNTCCVGIVSVAVFRTGKLWAIRLSDGNELLLEEGFGPHHGNPAGFAYGCEDTVGGSNKELTQVVVTRRGRAFYWTKVSYDLRRDRAVLVNNESGERRARGDVALAARRLTSECRIKSDS